MHFVTFVIIGTHDSPDEAVARALEPFDENADVEPCRAYLSPSAVQHMADRYGIPPSNLPALARKMKDWSGREGGVDDHGLYAVTTCNPDGKWDWYEIGGRWDGYIPGSRRNVIGTRALVRSRRLRKCLPYYLVTPDGRWLESGAGWRFGPPKTAADRRADFRWYALVRRVLTHYADGKAVCVDIHS